MQSNIETITPEKARKYLEQNAKNRPLSKGRIDRYAKDMANGRWKVTHQGIAFNCDGTLLDGQHRLHAIVKSGIPQRMLVSSNVSADAQLVMDDHAKRSAGDALSVYLGEKISREMVSTIRGCIELGNSGAHTMTKQEILSVLDVFRGPLEFIQEHMSTKQRGVTSAAVRAAIALAWFYVDDLSRLAEFCSVLCGYEMAKSTKDRAAVAIREWLIANGVKTNPTRVEAFFKTQRAIVAFMDYQPLTRIHAGKSHFEWPLKNAVRGGHVYS